MDALRFSAAAFAASSLLAAAALGSCGINQGTFWICLNPVTGKEDTSVYDANHYDVDGTFDPCHCYDPCGPEPQCPFLVDAGPADAGCDAH